MLGASRKRAGVTAVTWAGGPKRHIDKGHKTKRGGPRVGTGTMRRIDTFAIDTIAVAAAAILASPFVAVFATPFVCGL